MVSRSQEDARVGPPLSQYYDYTGDWAVDLSKFDPKVSMVNLVKHALAPCAPQVATCMCACEAGACFCTCCGW